MSGFESLIGEVLNERFRIDAILGEGGMGVVFRGSDLATASPVAVKFLKLNADPIVFRRFEREADLIAQLNHPNIVQIIDKGRFRDLPYMVLELIDGEELAHLLARGRLSPKSTIELGLGIADALHHAHGAGAVHRDIKPGNILVRETPSGLEAKLVDFGVARISSEQTALTTAGSLCGTPGYVSPEQLRGEKPTAQADLYSVGIVLFECLTGTRAYPGTDPYKILTEQQSIDVPTLDQFPWLGIPAELTAVVSDLLRRDRAERVGSAWELVTRLRTISDNLPSDTLHGDDSIAVSKTEPPPLRTPTGPIRVVRNWDQFLNPSVPDGSAGAEAGQDIGIVDLDRRERQAARKPVESRVSNVQPSPEQRERPTRGNASRVDESTGVGWYIAIALVIFVGIVSIFFWRAKVAASRPPQDVIEVQLRPQPPEPPRWRANEKTE